MVAGRIASPTRGVARRNGRTNRQAGDVATLADLQPTLAGSA
jgi:hypothetical protein